MTATGEHGLAGSTTAPSRRQLLISLAALTAAAATGCSDSSGSSSESHLPGVNLRSPAAKSDAPLGRALALQVLAHPDDDLYFMNPDMVQGIRAGIPLVSVYVTAAEADGVNKTPRHRPPRANQTAYSASRHQGLRQAYALMLGATEFAAWQQKVMPLPDGMAAEVNTLEFNGRRAELIFLQLREFGADGKQGGNDNLPELWSLPGATLPTLVAEGSPVRTELTYRRENLINVLAYLMDQYRPTVIRTLDPDPDIQVHDAKHPKAADQPGYSDHRDHTTSALFAWAAMNQWTDTVTKRTGHPPRFVTAAYRGYYNQRWPFNLSAAVVRLKSTFLDGYGGRPDLPCHNPAGCGDYAQGQGWGLRNKRGWARSTRYRYPNARPVADTGPDGRVTVYGVLSNRATRWRETAPGSGHWEEPRDLGGGTLAPGLSLVKDSGGKLLLFGLRFSGLAGDDGGNTREIVMLEQASADAPAGTWQSLDNPETSPSRGRRIGTPLAVALPDGRIFLFVRNAAKAVSLRIRDTTGRWGGWRNLGGAEVHDGLSAVIDSSSRVHLFAAGRDAVHHWAQPAPSQPMVYQPLGSGPVPADGPGAAALPDGTLQLLYSVPNTGRYVLQQLRSQAPSSLEASGWSLSLAQTDLYGPGQVSMRADGGAGRTTVVSRNPEGTVVLSDVTGNGVRSWPEGHRLTVGLPVLAETGKPGPTVVAMGLDAAPWVWRPFPGAHA